MCNPGYKHSEETKQKISIAKKGKTLSVEHKEKIKISLAGRVGSNLSKFGNLSCSWKGGRSKTPEGYVLIYNPTHPSCTKKGYVREHRFIMEKHISRLLSSSEQVHHINGIKDDNRIENLKIFSSNQEHCYFHGTLQRKSWFCTIKGCPNIHYSKGLCSHHYRKARKEQTS